LKTLVIFTSSLWNYFTERQISWYYFQNELDWIDYWIKQVHLLCHASIM